MASPPAWHSGDHARVLENDAIMLKLQAGIPVQLLNKQHGTKLIDMSLEEAPTQLPLFGAQRKIDLDQCQVVERADPTEVHTTYQAEDGSRWSIHWKIEPGKGDLILQTEAHTPEPAEEFRYVIPGCNLQDHTLVWVDGYGVGRTATAPWNDRFLADPFTEGSPSKFPHPPVALFEGSRSGWFVEMRDAPVGPTCLMARGQGKTAVLGANRRFIVPTRHTVMHEIRIRTYNQRWENAVAPFVEWMEKDAGFVPLDKLPPQQSWVARLKTQAYVGVTDYETIDELATYVDPAQTFIGRQGEFRYHAFDIAYPDYRVPKKSAQWARHVRDHGFHVGMHFNIGSVSEIFPDLVKRFEPGMQVIGTDEQGNNIYESIRTAPSRMYRVSSALKAWRVHLVEQIRHAVEAGIDVIYLDEAMAPHGRIMVGDTDGFQGVFLLMQEILERYPHVAIETEQFNMLTAKYGKIALSQMPLGHPLSACIFRKFVKVVPEGVMYSPTDVPLLDAFDSWGMMLPGGDPRNQKSWLAVIEAYHRYNLAPDISLPRNPLLKQMSHWTGGVTPIATSGPPPTAPKKLFGLRGDGGVTAYFEKHPTRRGLVVYEPGAEPKWFGTRHSGIRNYDGPGLPVYTLFRHEIKDWLIHDRGRLLGLNPAESYAFDETLQPTVDRFHLYRVPDDFVGVTDMESRTPPQEIGPDDQFFRMVFTGHGEIGVYVPESYEAYLNGHKLEPDPNRRRATATINASHSRRRGLGYHIELGQANSAANQQDQAESPAWLIAFRKTDFELEGNWINLPWYGSQDSGKWITGNGTNPETGFLMTVGACIRLVGKIPAGREIRIQGSYRMNPDSPGHQHAGDCVMRINGSEVYRAPHGDYPYPETEFDVDISEYAGKYVFLEFTSAGSVRGGEAYWNNPEIVVTR
jgi:hypothetical protein